MYFVKGSTVSMLKARCPNPLPFHSSPTHSQRRKNKHERDFWRKAWKIQPSSRAQGWGMSNSELGLSPGVVLKQLWGVNKAAGACQVVFPIYSASASCMQAQKYPFLLALCHEKLFCMLKWYISGSPCSG